MDSDLQLLTLDDIRIAGVRRFRVSTLSHALTVPIVGAVILGCLWAGWHGGVALGKGGGLPGFIAWWIALSLAPYWLLVLRDWRKATRPHAWLAATGDNGVFVKWRSYRNAHWGHDDVQVVFIPYRLIAAARGHRRWWITPSDNNAVRAERKSYVELRLSALADASALAIKLADERNARPGGRKQHSTWVHFPVSLETGNTLRIEWQARPRMQVFLELLRQHHVSIETMTRTTADLSRRHDDSTLNELARRGDTMALIRVLRHDDGLSLEQAKTKAEALVADARTPGA